MNEETKVTLSTEDRTVETTVGRLSELAAAMGGTVHLYTELGERVSIPMEQIEELLTQRPELRRPKFRTLVSLTRKRQKEGDVWLVKGAWVTATEGGIPDRRELTVGVNELPSPEFLAAVRRVERLAADYGGLDERLSVELDAWEPQEGGASSFKLTVKDGTDRQDLRLKGQAKYAVALFPGKQLAEAIVLLEVLSWRLSDGGERAQGEMAL